MSTILVVITVVAAGAAVYLAVGLLLGRLFYRLGYDFDPTQGDYARQNDADIARWVVFWCWPVAAPILGVIFTWKALRRRFRWPVPRLHPFRWASEWMARDVDRRAS